MSTTNQYKFQRFFALNPLPEICEIRPYLTDAKESWNPKAENNFPHGQWTGTNVYPNVP